jgi:hypothetical protein
LNDLRQRVLIKVRFQDGTWYVHNEEETPNQVPTAREATALPPATAYEVANRFRQNGWKISLWQVNPDGSLTQLPA